MITGINKSRTLTKHLSCKCECKFDDRKCNLKEKQNNNKCWCKCKKKQKKQCVWKNFFWNPATCSHKNGKYVGSINGDSVVISCEIKDMTKSTPTKTIPTQIVPTKCASTNFYF